MGQRNRTIHQNTECAGKFSGEMGGDCHSGVIVKSGGKFFDRDFVEFYKF
jgi:hypothetical protein